MVAILGELMLLFLYIFTLLLFNANYTTSFDYSLFSYFPPHFTSFLSLSIPLTEPPHWKRKRHTRKRELKYAHKLQSIYLEDV